jgi:DNA polymerase-4
LFIVYLMKPSNQTSVTPNKSIVHMDLDTFFVSVERLQNSSLNGKPLLIGGTGDRSVVASCSYEARKFGVHSAMPMKLALRMCPDAIVMRGDYEQYSKYSHIVTDIIKEQVPLYEKTSIDEFYIDLTGMDRFFGCYTFASELRQKIIKESGLPISFGQSVNKTVSKVATGEAKPNGQLNIIHGTEKPFLGPLSIKKIPMVGDKTYHLLKNMGVQKIQTVQEMPVELMERLLGESGVIIWKKANGIDNTPVIPYSERKSISTEETFQIDTIDVNALRNIMVSMTEKLGFQLRNQKKLTSCITVKVRYSNFDTHTMQARIPYTACDHVLIKRVKELFEKLYTRRMLVRLIGVRVSHLVSGNYQINLFDDTEEMMNLYQAIDRMKARFGEQKIIRAVGIKQNSKDKFRR